MKYQKYKQICRLTFIGADDEYRGIKITHTNPLSYTMVAGVITLRADTKKMKF